MPLDQISAYMDYNTLSNVPVKISYHFSNGRLTFSSHSLSGVDSGKANIADPNVRPVQRHYIGADYFTIQGNLVSFYCDFDVNCDTDLLTGTIEVQKPLPVTVCLGSNTTGEKVKLAPGQLQLNFQLKIADRVESGKASRLDNG